MKFTKLYDISVILGEQSIDYPGDTPYKREMVMSLKESGLCDQAKLTMSSHAGTHIDLPAHFIENKKFIHQYKVEDFVLPAVVVAVTGKKSIGPGDIENLVLEKGSAILFKTDNSLKGICRSGPFRDDYVYLTGEAAEACVKKGVSLVGLDYISVEKHGDDSYPAHFQLLGNDIIILESINLEFVPPGPYTLCCLPLNIKDGEASPLRAVLFKS